MDDKVRLLAQAHDATIASMQTIEIKFTRIEIPTRLNVFDMCDSWTVDSSRERSQRTYSVKSDKAKVMHGFIDTLAKEGRFYQLNVPDLSLIDNVSVAENYGVTCSIEPYSRDHRSNSFARFAFGLNFSLLFGDQRRTLSEVVDEYDGTHLLEDAEVDGHFCKHLRANHPGMLSPPTTGHLDIFLDPAVGFLARRIVSHIETENGQFEMTIDISDFQDCGEGVWFPRKSIQTVSESSKTTTFEVTKLSVNQPLKGDAFDFQFPKNSLVHIVHVATTGHPVPPAEIWLMGDQGVVDRKFDPESAEWKEFMYNAKANYIKEHPEVLTSSVGPGASKPPSWWRPIALATCIFAFLLAVSVWVRRRRRRGAGQHAL